MTSFLKTLWEDTHKKSVFFLDEIYGLVLKREGEKVLEHVFYLILHEYQLIILF